MSNDEDNKIIPFVPLDSLTAAENVGRFVKLCRDELTVFGGDLDWDASTWDLTGYVLLRGKTHRVRANWTNHDTSKQAMGALMEQPLLDFAKSYFRYQHSVRPTKAFAWRLAALRALERALCEIKTVPRIDDADAAIFNRAAQLVQEKFDSDAAYRIGKDLQLVADFVSDKRLVRMAFSWESPIGRRADKNRVGKEHDKARAKSLPSQEALNALAKAFVLATDPRDVLISSVGAILCSAPSRISEVLTLPCECEHEDSRSEKKRYALRWWPAKGAAPMLKWIVASMEEVARDAVRKLRKVTEPWRQVAKWYEEHPDQVYLPEGYEHLRASDYVLLTEVAALLGYENVKSARRWLRARKVMLLGHRADERCSFAEFEKAVIAELPKGFPILDRETGLRFSDALFVVPQSFFQGENGLFPLMISAVGQGTIMDGFGNRQKYGFQSVFSRLGITAEDGTPIVIRSHQFRHLLNTLAQLGGASQLDIAKWSGRKDVRQNENYDHVTAEQLLVSIRESDGGSILGPFEEFLVNSPIPKAEFLSVKMPTAHVTEIGFCMHDWTMLPCQRHLDCINCTAHVCVKGDRDKNERIRVMFNQSKELLEEAERAHAEEYTGADRWLAHQRPTVERLGQLVKLLDDPSVQDGAVITLSIKGEYSAIANAVDDRSRLGLPDSEALALSFQRPALPNG